MSLFAKSYSRFAGENVLPGDQNITYRKKISAVSTSLQGDDGQVAASPRNVYTRNNVVPLRRRVFEETDGAAMSIGQTPVEQRAAEIRRMNGKNEKNEQSNAPPAVEGPSSPASSSANQKKSRTSTSSLASVFRSRASSPIEKVRKFITRSSSKQPKELPTSPAPVPVPVPQVQKVDASQQCDSIAFSDAGTMTDAIARKPSIDKENVRPEVICLDDVDKMRSLENEVAELRKLNAELTDDFRRTRNDFVLIIREAVNRKDEAESKLEAIQKSATTVEDDEWGSLMAQHRHTLRRNVLLMWAQKKLEPYSISVSNFSSDWTDCRALCALLHDLFPAESDVNPLSGDCVGRCRRTFQHLGIPFDERALGLTTSPTDSGADDSSTSSISGLTDWRYIMNTVFVIYKRGVLGK